jgi:bacteriocin biosynthesis cyclodehydratase domain-containing protein
MDEPEVPLPHRPRLLPGLQVLQRGPDEVQIGLDPAHAVVAERLPRALLDTLRQLDGRRTAHELLDLAEGEHVELLRAVLAGLNVRGLLEEAAPRHGAGERHGNGELWPLRAGLRCAEVRAHLSECAVVVHGSGRLAVAVATLLASAGVGHIDVEAAGVVGPAEVGCGHLDSEVGTHRRDAIRAAVRRANPATRTSRLIGPRDPDLVVLTDHIVTSPEIVGRLMTDRLLHLPVRVRDGVGVVGPLVAPGRSSCLRCADLHRADRDHRWPLVAAQLAGRTQVSDLGSVHTTAGVATAQVLRALSPATAPPPTWNTTIEVDPYAATTVYREWSPHPLCHCGARRERVEAGTSRHQVPDVASDAARSAARAPHGRAESRV